MSEELKRYNDGHITIFEMITEIVQRDSTPDLSVLFEMDELEVIQRALEKSTAVDHPMVPVYDIGQKVYIYIDGEIIGGKVTDIDVHAKTGGIATFYHMDFCHDKERFSETRVHASIDDLKAAEIQRIKDLMPED